MGSIPLRQRPGPMRLIGTLALLALGVPALAGCGSSSKPSAAVLGTPLSQACTAVTDVLMNGPDPDADPIGYAEAQPVPLQAVTTSDGALKTAIDALAGAYRSVVATNGSKAADAAVKTASAKVDAVCPGATS
jgi:hypothetical protein